MGSLKATIRDEVTEALKASREKSGKILDKDCSNIKNIKCQMWCLTLVIPAFGSQGWRIAMSSRPA